MKKRPKLCITNPLVIAIGILLLLPGAMVTMSNGIAGISIMIIALLFLTQRSEFTIDPETSEFRRSFKVFFIKLNSSTSEFSTGKGKVELIDSNIKLYGINKQPSTFYTYDVIYRKLNHHPVYLFTSTSSSNSRKVAEFFSKNLNIQLKLKSISK